MSDALRAEWAKLTGLRSTTWALVAMVVLTVLLGILINAGAQTEGCPEGGLGCDQDLMEMALGGVYLGQFAVVALGVMAIGSEFASGMLRTTFAAMPRRRDVLAAKALVVGGLVFACALVAGALAYLAGLSLLQSNGYTEANGYAPPSGAEVFRGVVGTAAYLAALALLSLGIGTVVRHTAAAISAVLALLWVPVMMVSMLSQEDFEALAGWCPMLAGLAIQETVERPDSVIAPGAGLLLFCAYTAIALGAGFWLLERRDA